MLKSISEFQRLLIYNARIISQDKIVKNGWILIEQAKIKALGTKKIRTFSKTKLINARNNFVAPGFIDLHIHGNPEEISLAQIKYGTTGFCLTLHADKISSLCSKMEQIKKAEFKGAKCLGFHLEGPFINKEMAGAQPKKFIIKPHIRYLKQLLACAGKKIKIVTLACELKGCFVLIKILQKERIIIGLGHTNASFEKAQQAVKMGASYGTHVFNRMAALSSRQPGVIAEMLLDERITTEVIVDGRHVHPALLKLLVKNKPQDKIVLITDSVAAMDKKDLRLIKNVYCQEDFTIAGSNLTMMEAIKNIIKFCDVDIVKAVNMASLNPAKVLRLTKDKGSLGKGKDADLVIFDEKFKVKMTLVSGKIVFSNS